MDANFFLDVIKNSGPVALLLFGACVVLWRRCESLQEKNDRLVAEKEEMYKEWKKETDARSERLTSALASNTTALTTNAGSIDTVKVGLNAIMQFIAGVLRLPPPRVLDEEDR